MTGYIVGQVSAMDTTMGTSPELFEPLYFSTSQGLFDASAHGSTQYCELTV